MEVYPLVFEKRQGLMDEIHGVSFGYINLKRYVRWGIWYFEEDVVVL